MIIETVNLSLYQKTSVLYPALLLKAVNIPGNPLKMSTLLKIKQENEYVDCSFQFEFLNHLKPLLIVQRKILMQLKQLYSFSCLEIIS